MKAIKWAGTGASLLDPVYAHMITPKYEHVAKRRCCCVPVLLRAGGTRPATTGTECRPRVQQRPERQRRLRSTEPSGFHPWWSRAQRSMNAYSDTANSAGCASKADAFIILQKASFSVDNKERRVFIHAA